MDRTKLLDVYRPGISVLGAVALSYCLLRLPIPTLGVGFAGLLLFAVVIAPRMSLVIPRSNVAIGFSDALIFLGFLLYGPEAAVVIALTRFGVSPEQALGIAVVQHLCYFVALALPGLLVAARSR
jgi:hypothetical protein